MRLSKLFVYLALILSSLAIIHAAPAPIVKEKNKPVEKFNFTGTWKYTYNEVSGFITFKGDNTAVCELITDNDTWEWKQTWFMQDGKITFIETGACAYATDSLVEPLRVYVITLDKDGINGKCTMLQRLFPPLPEADQEADEQGWDRVYLGKPVPIRLER